MSRSLAARLPTVARRPPAGRGRLRRRAPGSAPAPARRVASSLRAASRFARRAAAAHRAAARLVALPLLGGGWLWLRQSPFVAVQHVQIVGRARPRGAGRATRR